MKRVLSYKIFTSPEEFESWQVEAEREIVQIAPMVVTFDMSLPESYKDLEMGGKTKLGVSVVYWREVEVE